MFNRTSYVEAMPTELPILDGLYDLILEKEDQSHTVEAYTRLQSVEKYAIMFLVRDGNRHLIHVTDYDKYITEHAKSMAEIEEVLASVALAEEGVKEEAIPASDMVSEGGSVMREDEHLYYDEAC